MREQALVGVYDEKKTSEGSANSDSRGGQILQLCHPKKGRRPYGALSGVVAHAPDGGRCLFRLNLVGDTSGFWCLRVLRRDHRKALLPTDHT